MRTTVAIRSGALLAAAAMAGAALAPQTGAFDFVALAREAAPRVLVSSAYPFDPWSTPVHLPTPQDLSLPPAPPPPSIADPTSPGSLSGTGTFPGSNLGIPVNVLAAYIATADKMADLAPGCGLTWEMLAGIGQVESRHAGGGSLTADGTTVTSIVGPALDGGAGIAQVGDSDGGRYDGDRTWDRAVGPMQFLPGTWRAWGTDGNADGVEDPNNIYDATLAAAQYLCAGGQNLGIESNLRAALYAYNPSNSYVETVLAWIRAYQRSGGVPVLPTPTTPTPPTHLPPSEARSPGQSPSPNSPPSNPPADRQAPTTPANLRATGKTATSVSLAWSASRDNVSVTAYEVFVGDRLVATVTGTKLTVNGLAKDRAHNFTVRARDAAGNRSPRSAPVTVVTDVTPPTVPANPQIVQQDRDSAVVRWAAARDNLDSSVSYLAFVRLRSGQIATGVRVAVDGTTATVQGLTAGVSYTIEVFAVDANGNRSTPGAATIPADREDPTAPTGLTGVAQPPNPDDPTSKWSVKLAWRESTDDVRVTGYEVSYAKVHSDGSLGARTTVSVPASNCAPDPDGGDVICRATVTSSTGSPIVADATYKFAVAGRDAAGGVSPKSTVQVKTGSSTGGTPSPTPTTTPSASTSSPPSVGSTTSSDPSSSASSSGGSSTPTETTSGSSGSSASSSSEPTTEPTSSPTEPSPTPTESTTSATTDSTATSTETPTASPTESSSTSTAEPTTTTSSGS